MRKRWELLTEQGWSRGQGAEREPEGGLIFTIDSKVILVASKKVLSVYPNIIHIILTILNRYDTISQS